ncbi:MAG TPA: hypothetical protein VE422_45195 [Terriglobia bacterium]|nr:hypothetical protein [Terriglobia bacterium]
MAHSLFWHCLLSILLVAGAIVRPGNAQAPASGPPFSVEDVVKLWKTNVPEELIITMIKKNAKAFNLSTEEVLELRSVGISANVVKFLLDPSQPYVPPSPSAAPVPAAAGAPSEPPKPPRNFAPDARAAQVPADPGLYRFSDGVFVKTDIKLLLGEQQGAGVGKVLMKKGKAIGYLLGPTAKTRINEPTPVFYLRPPEGKGIEEVVLVAFDQKKTRREIEIGQTLDKQELKAEAMRPFDPAEVGPRLFRITVTDKLTKGEYLLLLLGSAEPPKGSYGKGYDFGIDAPR